MAGPSPELAAALDAIVAQLRRVLRELEEDDIPVPLRKVAKSTGKRLPPPLLRSLLVEVDRNEWFREKAREEIDAEAHPDAAAFLSRDPGWWIDLADQAVASAGVSSRAEEAQRIALARNEEALGEAKRRGRELRAENATLTAEVKTLKAALRSAPPGAKASARRDGLAAQLRAAEAQLERERRQRLEADARVSELLRRRTERHRRSEAAAARSGGLDDPVAVGRRLDLEVAALAAAARGEQPAPHADDEGVAEEGVRLPAGVLPDSADAITWLLSLPTQVTLIVDGYNAGFLLNKDDRRVPAARRRVLEQLDRLDRLAMAPHRIVVVFDSPHGGADAPAIDPGGIEVRFATEAATADDDIVDLVAALTSPAIVVTNDRELRDRVEARGALALWATALAEWVRAA